jgi:predicted amidophosphoribosyltransferase
MLPRRFTYSGAERLLAPRRGPGVCPRCLNLTDSDVGLCRACRSCDNHLAAVVPISYSVGGEWLHQLVAAYKRDADPSVPDAAAELASILDRFLALHETCVAAATCVERFSLVTSIPSGDPVRDELHPLRRIVGDLASATAGRYARLLHTAAGPPPGRRFNPRRYRVTGPLHGEPVLLIDDMWTSGASAQSAAAALRAAGAGPVAAVVIARHLNRSWDRNDARLRGIERRGFTFSRCVACSEPEPAGLQGSAVSL